jgi:NarL family two-component system response regulator LiaR
MLPDNEQRMNEFIRVLVVDDHPIVQEGLSGLVTSRYGMAVVGQAKDGNEAVKKAHSLKPDVILMDLVMPGKSGLETIIEIRTKDPQAHILVLTSFGEEDRVLAAIKAGALGYLMKDSCPDELLHAIREVAKGNLFLPENIALKFRNNLQTPQETPPPPPPLTERELEVLKLVAQGLSNKQIASQLTVSEVTIRYHVSSILERLELSNRIQAAVYAVQKGLVNEDEIPAKE